MTTAATRMGAIERRATPLRPAGCSRSASRCGAASRALTGPAKPVDPTTLVD
jgi:hypothetical protein